MAFAFPTALRRLLLLCVAVVAVAAAPALARAAAPAGPTGIATTGSVELAWQPAVGATAYTVYRGTSATAINTAVTPPGGVAAPATSFADTSAVNGTTYYYAVRAVIGGVESPNSLVVQATPVARSCSTGNPVVLENCYAGATTWNVRSAAQMPSGIEGYATAQSINKGGSVDLKVNSPASFNIEVYRTGWYGGREARLFSIIRGVPASSQPACSSDANTGLYDCSNWSVSTTLTTTSSWPSGVYFLRLVRTDNSNDNAILLVVRDDARHPDVIYGEGMTTLQAYNNYGGKSLYDFNSSGATTVGGTPRAVKVSFNRPFEQPRSGLRDWYTNTEIATVAWLEENGYDTSYISNGDLDTNGSLLLNAKTYISPAHDEYVSTGMRTAMENARDAGVNLFFTGSNEVYWRIRFEGRTQVCYKTVQGGAADPVTPTSTWRDPNGPNKPENALTGEMYIGDNDTTYFPLVVTAAQGQDRIWRYTGLDQQAPGTQQVLGGNLVGWEWDARVNNGQEPAGVKTLSGSPVNGELIQGNGASYIQNQNATVSVVKYKAASGALVLTTGTNHWNRGLANNAFGVGEPSSDIQQATVNILEDMGVRPSTPQAGIVLDLTPGVGPTPPTNVTATTAGADSINVSWTAVPGVSGYNVYRALAARDNGFPLGVKINTSLITGTSATDINLVGATKYYYVVTAVASGVEGYMSSEASATTLAGSVIRINSGGPAYTAGSGAVFAADGNFTGGSTYSISQSISGTNDPALYQNERWGQFTYNVAVPNGTYDVRMHFAELYYGTSTSGSCVGKRIFGIDILDTSGVDIPNTMDVCAQAGGPRIALVKTIKGVNVTDGQLNVKSVYGSVDDPEMTALEIIPAVAGPVLPTVTSTTPANGATGVATSVAPSATFSTAMNAATLTTSTFTLKDAGGNSVAGTVAYNAGTTAATFTPSAALQPSTGYTATLTTGVQSSGGTALAGPVTWSFTTAAAPDTQKPTAPSNLTATIGLSQVAMSWTGSTDNVGVVKYDVYRSQQQGFTPAPTNRIAQPTGTSYTDAGIATGTYYYKVAAEDAAGNISDPSNEFQAVVTGDTTAPTVSITAPTAGATVSGSTVGVTANASDNVGVVGVQFKLDGTTNLGAEDTTSPYSVTWDTTSVANGNHTITAIARDAAGNNTTAAGVTVNVQNTAPPPATYVFGDQTIEPSSDFNPGGSAEAFQYTANAGGSITQLSAYIDTGNAATSITVGLYASNGTHPGALLTQGTLANPKVGWNDIPVPAATVTSGATYWIALLSPNGNGQVKFRDRCCGGGGNVESSSSTTLTTLPSTWATGSTFKDGPASLWAGGPGTTLPPPDQIGRWSAPESWPIVAVHMSLLPTGNVIAYDGFDAALNSEHIWNPTTDTMTPVPYGRNLFCAGHVLLPDGRTLIVGGHIAADDGSADTTVFNSSTNQWTRLPDMSVGRWYPTATEMGNGKVFVFSGDNIVQDRTGQTPPFTDASVNSLPEVFDPVTNTWQDLTSSKLTSPLYPRIFQLSDGRLIDVGPDTTTRTITPGTWVWNTLTTAPFDGMSSVMYRPDKIMSAGAWADPDFKGSLVYNANARTAVLDMTQPSPTWRETSPMAFPRSYQNLTLLPDGNVLASGGMTDSDGVDQTKAVLPAEIWDATTEKWTTVASEQVAREYHSTALLLPDGRVLMAGGGQLPGSGAIDEKNAEIYSPPYLFKGTRPTITSTPGTIQYGANFTVSTPDAASISKVALIRTPSVTHAFDQNGRYIPLNFTIGSGQLTVTAPSNANLAPPGYYMLFILNGNGVPSVAPFVRFPAPWEDTQPPTAPTGLAGTPGTGSVALSWTAATDNVGVVKYDVYRSTTSGFTPGPTNLVGTSATASFNDTGLAQGTYFYVVKAEDAAGNIGPASAQASATVTGDAQPPTAPSGLTATPGTTSVALGWTGSTDNVGVVKYDVYRSTTSGFTPSTANRIAQPAGTTYTDNGLATGTYFYKVAAEDAAGNISAASNEATATVAGDTTFPTVSITSPTGGSVSGTINVTANASDDVGVTSVQFKLDGANLGSADTTSPYSVSWNTTATANGGHQLTAVASDAAGHQTTSAIVSVSVSNTASVVLVGDQTLETKVDFNNEGLAEAAQYTATASGTVNKASVYVDGGSTSTQILVGVYTNATGNHPGTLIATGTLTTPVKGAWNNVTMTSTAAVASGTSYWIAILSPVGSGTVKFREKGGTKVEISASSTLSSLPSTWSSGSAFTDGPFSAYASS